MQNIPRFLFVGTAKAGTTSIYHYLQQHPEIAVPQKETFFFLRDVYADNILPYPQQRAAEGLITNESEYLKIYKNCPDRVCGEIGTGYLYHHRESIPRIIETLGEDVKILIILRRPSIRCFSGYMHFVKDLHEKAGFKESLKLEEERKARNWDFMWYHKSLGCYSEQVRAYRSRFKHVKVLIYEDFAKDPESTMREIFSFIGVRRDVPLQLTRQFNPSGKPKNPALQRFITNEHFLKRLLRPLLRAIWGKEKRAKMRKSLKAKNLKTGEAPDPDVIADLETFYADDIARLEKDLGYEIDAWKRT